MMLTVDSIDLLDACRTGDPAALERLVRAHEQAVFRLALALLDEPHEAEEAAQDALLAAINGLAGFRGEAAFSTWLYAITVNTCRRRLRWRRARARLHQALQTVLRLEPAPVGPEDAVIAREGDARLWQAVAALDDRHRVPLILRYDLGLSSPEIAHVLGIPSGTVDRRLHTARARLRAALEAVSTAVIEEGRQR